MTGPPRPCHFFAAALSKHLRSNPQIERSTRVHSTSLIKSIRKSSFPFSSLKFPCSSNLDPAFAIIIMSHRAISTCDTGWRHFCPPGWALLQTVSSACCSLALIAGFGRCMDKHLRFFSGFRLLYEAWFFPFEVTLFGLRREESCHENV